jgi:hypothetical protein
MHRKNRTPYRKFPTLALMTRFSTARREGRKLSEQQKRE